MFHLKCVHLDVSPAEDWVCPECVLVMAAENLDTRWAFSLYLYLYFQLLSVFVLSSCICVFKYFVSDETHLASLLPSLDQYFRAAFLEMSAILAPARFTHLMTTWG